LDYKIDDLVGSGRNRWVDLIISNLCGVLGFWLILIDFD
jgi:hypothetical protein